MAVLRIGAGFFVELLYYPARPALLIMHQGTHEAKEVVAADCCGKNTVAK
jgi:hypothetical protein